jgi:hypothetical protein
MLKHEISGWFAPRRRAAWFVVVVLFGAALPAAAAGSAPSGDGIALVPLEVSGGMVVSREDLESAVIRGLAVAGRPVLPSAAAAERAASGNGALDCSSPACWSRLGALTNAGYLVSGSAARDGQSFRVRFRLVRAADGTTVASEDNSCEVADCSVAELARRSARELVRTTLGRAGEVRVAQAPSVEKVTGPVGPPAVQRSAPPPQPSPEVGRKRWVWPVLAGVGGLAVATGVVFIALDHKQISTLKDPPPDMKVPVFNSAAYGVAAVAGGVILAGIATYYIIHDGGDRGSRVALSIGPTGLSAVGRF